MDVAIPTPEPLPTSRPHQDCYSCHQKNDLHNGQFGTDCGACHTTSGWLPVTFDHALSSFKLTGARASVPCISCHINFVFKGTPTARSSCHADPSFHIGLFAGTPCDQCHNTTAQNPAPYTGPHPNFGERNCPEYHRGTCADCHMVNLMTATCTKCRSSNNPGERGGDGKEAGRCHRKMTKACHGKFAVTGP